MELYTDGSCTTGKNTITSADLGGCTNIAVDSTPIAPPACNNFGGDSRSMKLVANPGSATCTAAGGQVTGSATGAQPITFCCL